MKDLDCKNESLDELKRWLRDIEVGRSRAASLAALRGRANKTVDHSPKYGLFGESRLSESQG